MFRQGAEIAEDASVLGKVGSTRAEHAAAIIVAAEVRHASLSTQEIAAGAGLALSIILVGTGQAGELTSVLADAIDHSEALLTFIAGVSRVTFLAAIWAADADSCIHEESFLALEALAHVGWVAFSTAGKALSAEDFSRVSISHQDGSSRTFSTHSFRVTLVTQLAAGGTDGIFSREVADLATGTQGGEGRALKTLAVSALNTRRLLKGIACRTDLTDQRISWVAFSAGSRADCTSLVHEEAATLASTTSGGTGTAGAGG